MALCSKPTRPSLLPQCDMRFFWEHYENYPPVSCMPTRHKLRALRIRGLGFGIESLGLKLLSAEKRRGSEQFAVSSYSLPKSVKEQVPEF